MNVVSIDKLDQFDDAAFIAALERTLKYLLVSGAISPQDAPRGVLLGGQSGAGKTTLRKVFGKLLCGNAVIINGDEYRKSHPHFDELNKRYGKDAVSHTTAWAGKMAEALVDNLSRLGFNLIVEGTLRTSAVPLKTAELLRSRGYSVELALMAVKPEISLVSYQLRYEEMRLAGTTPRATDPKHHMQIVEDIVGNLEVLEKSDLFDCVYLYTRSEEQLFPRDGEKRTASEVLQDTLFGDWTEAERVHLALLEEHLAMLKAR